MTHTVQKISSINLTWFSTLLILIHIRIFHCAIRVCNQAILLIQSLWWMFLSPPEFTWSLALPVTTLLPSNLSSSGHFCYYTPCTWLKVFLLVSHCHFQTMSLPFLEMEVRGVGISPIPLGFRLPDLKTSPLFIFIIWWHLCHSPSWERGSVHQLLAVNLYIYINSCHNNQQLQPPIWLLHISWYYGLIVCCFKCGKVVWICFLKESLSFTDAF